MGQKVLVIGSGAREHTIAYTLLKAPSIDEVPWLPATRACSRTVSTPRS